MLSERSQSYKGKCHDSTYERYREESRVIRDREEGCGYQEPGGQGEEGEKLEGWSCRSARGKTSGDLFNNNEIQPLGNCMLKMTKMANYMLRFILPLFNFKNT